MGKLGKRRIRNLERTYPLSYLDGLTVWDEARLARSGVSVPALPDSETDNEVRKRLRALGIRGATDLEWAWPASGQEHGLRRWTDVRTTRGRAR